MNESMYTCICIVPFVYWLPSFCHAIGMWMEKIVTVQRDVEEKKNELQSCLTDLHVTASRRESDTWDKITVE